MNALQKIYYALGELAYVVAESDGKIQNSEVNKLHELVVNQIKKHNVSFEYSDIIFSVLNEEKANVDLIYNLAIDELKSVSNYLTPEIKEQIISVLTKIGESYHHVTLRQKEIIGKVELELRKLNV